MSAHTLPGPCLWIKEMCGLTQASESKLRGGGGVCQTCPVLTVFPPPGIIGRRPACWVLGAGCWLQPQATPACRGHRGPPSPRQVQWGTGTCYRVVCEHPAPRHPSPSRPCDSPHPRSFWTARPEHPIYPAFLTASEQEPECVRAPKPQPGTPQPACILRTGRPPEAHV